MVRGWFAHFTQVRRTGPLQVVVGRYQMFVGERRDGDRMLREAIKELAAVARPAPVKAKGELVEVVVQMRRAHTT